ncbi:MAG: hypothetical protein AB1297_02965 [bacterium]
MLKVEKPILPINREQDDLFICATSFEDRCRRATELLSKEFRTKKALVFFYRDTINVSYAKKNVNIINDFLERYTEDLYTIRCDFRNPYSLIAELDRIIKEGRLNLQNNRFITIDIACFTKLHLLLLLKYLSQKTKAVFRFIYTEPLTYGTIEGKDLSYGFLGLTTINYKLDSNTINKKNEDCYAFFLGHESIRTYQAFKSLEPERYWVLFGSPGFSMQFEAYSKEANESLIEEAKSFNRYEENSTKDPYLVSESLNEISKREKDVANLYFIPTGTKIQALGIFMFSQKITQFNIIISYPMPLRYEERSFSKGIGDSWIAFWQNIVPVTQEEGYNLGLFSEKISRAELYE